MSLFQSIYRFASAAFFISASDCSTTELTLSPFLALLDNIIMETKMTRAVLQNIKSCVLTTAAGGSGMSPQNRLGSYYVYFQQQTFPAPPEPLQGC